MVRYALSTYMWGAYDVDPNESGDSFKTLLSDPCGSVPSSPYVENGKRRSSNNDSLQQNVAKKPRSSQEASPPDDVSMHSVSNTSDGDLDRKKPAAASVQMPHMGNSMNTGRPLPGGMRAGGKVRRTLFVDSDDDDGGDDVGASLRSEMRQAGFLPLPVPSATRAFLPTTAFLPASSDLDSVKWGASGAERGKPSFRLNVRKGRSPGTTILQPAASSARRDDEEEELFDEKSDEQIRWENEAELARANHQVEQYEGEIRSVVDRFHHEIEAQAFLPFKGRDTAGKGSSRSKNAETPSTVSYHPQERKAPVGWKKRTPSPVSEVYAGKEDDQQHERRVPSGREKRTPSPASEVHGLKDDESEVSSDTNHGDEDGDSCNSDDYSNEGSESHSEASDLGGFVVKVRLKFCIFPIATDNCYKMYKCILQQDRSCDHNTEKGHIATAQRKTKPSSIAAKCGDNSDEDGSDMADKVLNASKKDKPALKSLHNPRFGHFQQVVRKLEEAYSKPSRDADDDGQDKDDCQSPTGEKKGEAAVKQSDQKGDDDWSVGANRKPEAFTKQSIRSDDNKEDCDNSDYVTASKKRKPITKLLVQGLSEERLKAASTNRQRSRYVDAMDGAGTPVDNGLEATGGGSKNTVQGTTSGQPLDVAEVLTKLANGELPSKSIRLGRDGGKSVAEATCKKGVDETSEKDTADSVGGDDIEDDSNIDNIAGREDTTNNKVDCSSNHDARSGHKPHPRNYDNRKDATESVIGVRALESTTHNAVAAGHADESGRGVVNTMDTTEASLSGPVLGEDTNSMIAGSARNGKLQTPPVFFDRVLELFPQMVAQIIQSQNPMLEAVKVCSDYVPLLPVLNEEELRVAEEVNMSRDPAKRFEIRRVFGTGSTILARLSRERLIPELVEYMADYHFPGIHRRFVQRRLETLGSDSSGDPGSDNGGDAGSGNGSSHSTSSAGSREVHKEILVIVEDDVRRSDSMRVLGHFRGICNNADPEAMLRPTLLLRNMSVFHAINNVSKASCGPKMEYVGFGLDSNAAFRTAYGGLLVPYRAVKDARVTKAFQRVCSIRQHSVVDKNCMHTCPNLQDALRKTHVLFAQNNFVGDEG